MESQNQVTLTQDQWRSVERLSDLLAETADLSHALQAALSMILATLGRTGGALFLPRFCEHITHDWTICQIPSAWEDGPAGLADPLCQSAVLAMKSGQVGPADPALDLAGAFPVLSSNRSHGALLVCGAAVAPEEYPFWIALLRPVARFVTLHSLKSGNHNGIPNYLDLMNSRNTLRAMFDRLPLSIYIIDPDYTVVAINQSRADRSQKLPDQLAGHKCYEKLYGRTTPCPECRAADTLHTGQVTNRMVRNWLDNARFTEWDIGSIPIYGENDTVIQCILIEQDVTEKRNLEANLVQSEKLAAVGQIAAGVAHEINNPLSAIIANAQILQREISPAEKDLLDSIKLIELAGTRASQVIRNLLNITRKEKYEFEPVDLNETLQNALSLIHHELMDRPIQVNLALDEHIPPALASRDQLQGVWINLFLNAIDAIDAVGNGTGELTISSRFTGNYFLVSISDNGMGITGESLQRVFEPFYTTKPAGRGTGLGLSVCQRVIRQHGGDILVDSEPGRGTRFTVKLPGS